MAAFFSSTAVLKSAVNLASYSFNFLTISYTSANFILASYNFSFASLSACLLGSTSYMTS